MDPAHGRRVRRRIVVFGLFAVAVAVFAAGSAAQEPAPVSGIVLEAETGRPIDGAVVTIVERGLQSLTAANGRFLIPGVAPGSYVVRVDRIGFEVLEQALSVPTAGPVELRLTTAMIELDAIIVSPGRFGVMGEASVRQQQTLTREDLETVPQVGEDVFRVLRSLPGVAVDDISTRLNVRGGTDAELLTTLDGVELYEPYHLKDFDAVFGIVDVQSIGGIELMNGGFGPQYGDKLTGVFSMATRGAPPAGTRTTVGLSVSNASIMSRGSFADRRGEWLVQARRGYLDLLLALTDSNDDDEELSPAYFDVFGKARYRLSPQHSIGVNALYAGDELDFVAPEGFVRSDWTSSYLWATWDAVFEHVSFETVGFAGRLERRRTGEIDDPEAIGSPNLLTVDDSRDFGFAGVREDVSISLHDRMLIKFGGEAKRLTTDYDYANRGRQIALLPDSTIGNVVDSVAVDLDPDGSELSAFTALRVRPIDALTAEVGVRWDRVSHSGDEGLSPRLLASYDVTSSTTVRGSYGLYRQSHGLHELEVGDGETTFFPWERATQLAFGVEQNLGSGYTARVEAYRRAIEDQRPRFLNADREIDAFPEAEGDRVRIDPGEGLARGLELLVAFDRGGPWSWSASYALAEAKDDLDGVWVPRTLDQRHALGYTAAYRPTSAWQFSWTFQLHTGWPATPSQYFIEERPDGSFVLAREVGDLNSDRLPAYHRLDFRVSRDFSLRGGVLEAYLDVFNLYNRANLRSYGYWPIVRNGQVRTVQGDGEELLPILPTIGFRWEF